MKRRNRDQDAAMTANAQPQGIPPWIDNFGRPVWNNPWNQYRPNTQGLAAEPVAMAPAPQPVVAPMVPTQPTEYPTVLPTKPDPRAAYEALLESGEFDRIRGTLQYAKGYAKACKELGLEVPEEFQNRLETQLAARRRRVHKRVRRTVATAAAVSASAVGMNAAAAYFTSGGSGTGGASAGSLQAVTANAVVVNNLIPDNSAHNVTVNVTNPNPFAVTVKSVNANGTPTADAGHPGCTTTGVTFTNQTPNQSVPGSGATTPITLTGAAKMDTTSADGCQGATFTIPVQIAVQKP